MIPFSLPKCDVVGQAFAIIVLFMVLTVATVAEASCIPEEQSSTAPSRDATSLINGTEEASDASTWQRGAPNRRVGGGSRYTEPTRSLSL